ncbi:glycosyltransferase [candidate division LCP-89 bacterium B3_LCP]|uniref:Glycosyltransferase n=1 Tax=candidate division LCP-89 bacterium B3_LCP TaxID=2012998 RepID=A0A532USS9_UNCL8|nr:MAG: glycosyltransferase [candidate division LCP-89 bacterium B3_LCP]
MGFLSNSKLDERPEWEPSVRGCKKVAKKFFFKVRIDDINLQDTLSHCENFIRSRVPHQIVIVNVAKLVKARQDLNLRRIINDADLVGADGMPLVWLSKYMMQPIAGRVNSTDLMIELVRMAAEKGHSIYFLGAKPDVVRKVVDVFTDKYPNLNVAGFRDGYFKPDEEDQVADEIRESGADIIFLAFGSPKKEKFVGNYLYRMGVPVVHGVGGSFDVVAGVTKRAPVWMQNWGLEWFYRFLQEPGRMWKRYLITNLNFLFLVGIGIFDSVPIHLRHSTETPRKVRQIGRFLQSRRISRME